MHTGLKLREVCRNTGSPDAEHRTIRCSPDLNSESSAKRTSHRTRTTGRTGFASDACRPVPYPSWARQCLHRTLRLSVRCSRSQRPVSVPQRETLPRLLQNSHRRNRKYALHFLKSANTILSLPFKLHLLSQSVPTPQCVNQQMHVC